MKEINLASQRMEDMGESENGASTGNEKSPEAGQEEQAVARVRHSPDSAAIAKESSDRLTRRLGPANVRCKPHRQCGQKTNQVDDDQSPKDAWHFSGCHVWGPIGR